MLLPCKIHICTTSADVRQLYAIYLHRDAEQVVQYVGVTPLTELFSLTDAQCNSVWADVFARRDLTTLEIEVIALTTDERAAYSEQRKQIARHQPYCNKHGYYIELKRQNILCNDTGEVFATISAAARAHNASQPALSNHLNRKPGFRTVKGRTYSRTLQEITS